VLGALADPARRGVLIVGRTRQVPFHRLPALRVETILQLAAVKTTSLAQSYERNDPLTYLLADGRDWAPTYLSSELVDTEYGSILNISDQLLKRWSNNGLVEYDNFKYQDPKDWGFKEALAITFVKKQHFPGLTFNWNTRGYGFVFPSETADVYCVDRTGSLPVSYIPKMSDAKGGDVAAQVLAAEDQGHSFFAQQSDPHLVRAAQYLTIYQIFKHFRDVQPEKAAQLRNYPITIKSELVTSYLTDAKVLSAKQLKADIQSFFADELAARKIKGLTSSLSKEKRDEITKTLEGDLHKWFDESSNAKLDRIGKKLAAPREQSDAPALLFGEDDEWDLEMARLSVKIFARKHAFQEEWAAKADEFATRDTNCWVHTPVIVVSRPLGEMSVGKGGHNLDAKTTPVTVEIDTTLKKGDIRVLPDGRGGFRLGLPDAAQAASNGLLRSVARGERSRENLRKLLQEIKPTPPFIALAGGAGSTPPPPRNPRIRGYSDDMPRRGWDEGSSASAGTPGGVSDGAALVVRVRRAPQGGVITLSRFDPRTGMQREVAVASPADATDCISELLWASVVDHATATKDSRPASRLQLLFEEGFTPQEADGMAKFARRRLHEVSDEKLLLHLEGRWFEKATMERNVSEKLLKRPIDVEKGIRVSDPGPITKVGDAFQTTFEVNATLKDGPDITLKSQFSSTRHARETTFKARVGALLRRIKEWATGIRGAKTVDQVLEDFDATLQKERESGETWIVEVRSEAGKMRLVLRFAFPGQTGGNI
jgi:hypothetical protein